MHIFMRKLFEILDKNCYEKFMKKQDPFVANLEEVNEALDKASSSSFNKG